MPTRITVTLEDDVRAQLESERSRSGQSFRDTVNETLRRGLGLAYKEADGHAYPFQVRAKNLGLKPSYSFDKAWDLIEEIEGANYR